MSKLYQLLLPSLFVVSCSAGHLRGGGGGAAEGGCEVPEDCDLGFDCRAGSCVGRGGRSALPSPTRCYDDVECPEGEACVSGVCSPRTRPPEPDDLPDDQPEPGEGEGEGEGDPAPDPPDHVSVPCVPDRFEPNDDSGHSTIVGAGTYEDLSLCDLDQDFFALRLVAGAALTATANGRAGMALQVLAPDGRSVVAGSQPSPGGARAQLAEVPADGVYYVQIAGPEVVSSYALTIGLAGNEQPPDPDPVDPQVPDPGDDPPPADPDPPACQDDPYEQNDSRNGASRIDAGIFPGLRVCDGDEDWFAIPLRRGDVVTVGIGFSMLELDLDLSVEGPDGEELAFSDDVLTFSEEVTVVAAQDGDHFIHVYPFVDPIFQLDTGGYLLTIEVVVAPDQPAACADAFDPNDARGAAAPIPPGVYEELALCGDDDWYLVRLDRTGPLEVFMTPGPDAGDLDLQVYDAAGSLIVASEGPIGEVEGIGGDAVDPGSYYFRVYGYEPDLDEGPYSLEVSY